MSDRQITKRQIEGIKWCEALRSGKYQQTAGIMKTQSGRVCAVGVYYEIASNSSLYEFYASSIFGLELTRDVIAMNDLEGRTFSEIADYIEKNLEITQFKVAVGQS